MDSDLRRKLDAWLPRLGGPGYKSVEDRDQVVAEMRAVGADRLFPLLIPMLTDSDGEVRCTACEALLWIDAGRAVELVLPLLKDPEEFVRWHACECLSVFGNDRAIASLIAVLQGDKDAQVRGSAARALGRIGGPAVIPVLLATMASDHEMDMHGHSPSHCAAMALDDILGTNETRIKVSETVRKMRPGKPDLVRLRRLAEERYQRWVAETGGDTRPSVSQSVDDGGHTNG